VLVLIADKRKQTYVTETMNRMCLDKGLNCMVIVVQK